MVWLELLLVALSAGLLGAGGIGLWRLERHLTAHAEALQTSGAILLEAQRQHARQRRIGEAQRLAEAGIDGGTAAVRAMHLGIAAIPFSVLEAIPPTRDVTRAVRQTHNLIADAVYGSIRGANRGIGTLARSALRPAERRRTRKDPSEPTT